VAIANALQLKAAWATLVLFRFNYDAHAKFDVAEPIHCYIIAFLLLIHYFKLWPWPWPNPILNHNIMLIHSDVTKVAMVSPGAATDSIIPFTWKVLHSKW